jgi:hypothetical protein
MKRKTKEWIELCRRHRLCLEQAARAFKAGHAKIGQGVLLQAEQIQLKIQEHVHGEQYHALLSERAQLVKNLHKALAENQKETAGKIGNELAALDEKIEAV